MKLTITHFLFMLLVTSAVLTYVIRDDRRGGHKLYGSKLILMSFVAVPWSIGLVIVLAFVWQMIAAGLAAA